MSMLTISAIELAQLRLVCVRLAQSSTSNALVPPQDQLALWGVLDNVITNIEERGDSDAF